MNTVSFALINLGLTILLYFDTAHDEVHKGREVWKCQP